MKNDKKCHLKNDKVEHVLPYHFLNDENYTHIVSPGNKKLIGLFDLYICVYSKEKNLK